MSKARLLIINGNQFGYSAGHYFYCKYLSNSFDISYACFDRGLAKLELTDVEIKYVPFTRNRLRRLFKFLKMCINESYSFRPQIILVTYFGLCFLLSLFCKYEKIVLDIRTGSLNKNILLRFINNNIIRIQSLFFNRIYILSESLREKLKISPKKSKIIPLGSEIYYPGDHDFKNINLMYVGALDGRNISATITGLAMFLKKKSTEQFNLSYTIIGFGSHCEILNLMSCILDNNLSKYVKYVGRKTHEELVSYFGESNIGVAFVPQKPWYEYQPVTKLFEYMLSGMPVIATNTYQNKLIVREINGVLINDSAEDFCYGLEKIYNHRALFKSEDIRKSVVSHTWENIVNFILKPFLLELI